GRGRARARDRSACVFWCSQASSSSRGPAVSNGCRRISRSSTSSLRGPRWPRSRVSRTATDGSSITPIRDRRNGIEMELMRPRRLMRLAALAVFAVGPPIGHLELIDSAWAEAARAAGRSSPAAREQTALPRPRPRPSHEAEAGGHPGPPPPPQRLPAHPRGHGEPQIQGLTSVYLHPLGLPADANNWRNIIVHQTEGPAGSAKSMALEQAKNPTKRGVMVWVETDGTVYWATAETAIPTHGDGAN